MISIPEGLVEHVQGGTAVLFLGAGASRSASDAKGTKPPTGKQLAELLSDRFLGGKHKEYGLAAVAELAISEHDLGTVQEYIRTILDGFNPSDHHRLIPTFRWWAIATTNYDLLIERAYQQVEQPLQVLVPFLKDGDRIDEKLVSRDSLMYAKLHGCITRSTDYDIPLILTPDQYITHRHHRSRLFDHIKLYGFEHPIVFVGSSLQDSDLRQMLLELSSQANRPRYYAVIPDFSSAEQRLWESKRITLINAKMEDFFEALDQRIPRAIRLVTPGLRLADFPLSKRFAVTDARPSAALARFLDMDAEYISSSMRVQQGRPREFFKGNNQGWSAIDQNLDVRRPLVDTILVDYFLTDEDDRRTPSELVVIKAHAGSGKTVCLRRIAWDAANEFDKLCVFLRKNGRLSYEALEEIWTLTKERVFVIVDNAAEHVSEIAEVLSRARRSKLPVTVLSAERVNEWNMSCERLDALVTESFGLPYLNHKEIEALIDLLARHNSLGFLQSATPEERIEAFSKRAGRQLLVALHEATLGRPLEEILVNEYNDITPESAQELYLNICVLNRFDVPVRAGLISRVQGITFEQFRTELFRPLEHVVHFSEEPIIRDHVFTTRHPHIAEVVFERTLTRAADRHDVYVRILNALNLDYMVDRIAFRRLIRGRLIAEQFPDHNMAVGIFESAGRACGYDAHYFHQLGIYEMHRPNGSLDKAHEYLRNANDKAPSDRTILHSLAELAYERADKARTELERAKFRKEARELATKLTVRAESPHGHHTLAKLALDRLEEVLHDESAQDRDIERAIQDVERHIEGGLQQFPTSEYLLTSESKLRALLKDTSRAVQALEKAFAVNPKSAYVASRLAECYLDNGRNDDALKTLETALDANPNEKKLHFAYAMRLMDLRPDEQALIEYHLRHSFTQGDSNYDAQFWYARHLYLKGAFPEAKAIFRQLRETPVAYALRDAVRGIVTDDGKTHRLFSGAVVKLEFSYGFVRLDGTGEWVFFHHTDVPEEITSHLAPDVRVKCSIGFSFKGPRAVSVTIESSTPEKVRSARL